MSIKKEYLYLKCQQRQTKKQEIMQRFSKTKTYTDKDGNKYSYMGKYRGYWNWLKFSDKNGLGGGWTTKSESEMLRLEFKELKNK